MDPHTQKTLNLFSSFLSSSSMLPSLSYYSFRKGDSFDLGHNILPNSSFTYDYSDKKHRERYRNQGKSKKLGFNFLLEWIFRYFCVHKTSLRFFFTTFSGFRDEKLFLREETLRTRWENAKKNKKWIMKDDSFVVEAFVKNVGKNYRNHKWIKKKFSIFSPVRQVGKNSAIAKVFLRWSWKRDRKRFSHSFCF